ncbi:hypothetical protein QQS21_010334 [Conoideocrella luteorostrata]|uniref:DegT/DnrJ/EryC1/StrS aminotransferase family protein n=1 Tax=Conoideocrella luteorostrata TaxID=1105319 RepID=A0AAJ0CG54_9HYPO|nr:hypothetical protein QQS21_010334 [Conoideocrella luteorostrata]
MAQIIRLHGLVPKAVDLSIKDLSVSARNVEALITPRTRAVLVAHLFGNRYSLRELSRVTRHHKLLLIEDCAQAFVGRSFTGDEDATISLFSFGPIKTCTAFGGALATIRDPELLLVMKAMQDNAPAQGQLTFLKRIIKYAGLKSLTQNAYIYGFFISLLNLLGKDHHQVIAGLGHSFSSEAALLSQIRFRPSLPLVNLLEHRLRRFDPAEIQDRTRCVTDLANLLPLSLQPIGFVSHVSRPGVSLSYWICPIRVNDPSATLKALFDAGFDAARGDSSLIVVLNGGTTPIRAREVMASVIYVPVDNQFTSSLAQCLIHTTRA